MEFSSHFGNIEFNEVIEEVLSDKEIKAELDRYPWMQSAVRQWKDNMKSNSETAGMYKPVQKMSSGSVEHLKAYLKAELKCEMQKKHYKRVQFEAGKARMVLMEHLDVVEKHDLDNNELVPGGLSTGHIDMDRYLPLVRELVDYSLVLAGFKEHVSSMDTMAQFVNSSRVRDYIDDLELCIATNESAALQDMQAALENSDAAKAIAKDQYKPKPINSFAEMITLLGKSEGSDNHSTMLNNQ